MRKLVCRAVSIGFIFVAAGSVRAAQSDLIEARPERTAMNSVYLELGGNAAWYSLNYERFMMDDAAVRVGLMFMTFSVSASSGTSTATGSGSWLAAPLTVSYLGIGSPNHKLELGAGAVMMYFSASGASSFNAVANANGFIVAPTAIVGYRYVPVDGGFNFKAGFTPLFISAGGKSTFLPWGGISVGYGF